jgi:ketosteroid isomerase-like protein
MEGERMGDAVGQGSAVEVARAWLAEMQGYVRAIDYAGARGLFRDDVVGFGTFSGVLDGLDNLVAGQWSNVWPTIRNFTFRLDEVRAGLDGGLLWAACAWDSLVTRPAGGTFERPGRMTVILTHDESGWRAAHTHFSLYPVRGCAGGTSPPAHSVSARVSAPHGSSRTPEARR